MDGRAGRVARRLGAGDVVRVHVRDHDARGVGPLDVAADAGVDEDRPVVTREHVAVDVPRSGGQRQRDPPDAECERMF